MREPIIDDAYELSPLQQGMLFHSLASPASGLYLITVDYTLRGPLDEAALLRAWDTLIARNDVMRTSFDWQVTDRPIQVVNHHVDGTAQLEDWRGVSSELQAQRVRELVARQREPMPLDQAPLMRVALVRVASAEWRLIWTFHHILLEGWSVSLLVKQLAALYEIERGGSATLPPARRYRDYLDWVREQDLGAAETYWRRTLAGFQGATSLDGRAAAVGRAESMRHERYQHALGRALGRRLHAFAREQRVTVNTILQGAWALLLSRYTGSSDVVFGAVVSGREVDVPGVDNVVGLCVNTLPMRVRVNASAAAGDWLRELQATQAAMRRYEWTSLLQVRGWSEVAAGQPLFETIFAYENWASDQSIGGLGDVALTAAASVQGGTGYPLAVAVMPGASPSASFEFDAARFDEPFVVRLARQFAATVAALCDDPARRLIDIASIDRAERIEVVEQWNATTSTYPRHASIGELFTGVTAQHPDSIAVEYHDATLTYAELDAQSNRLARYLRTLGVGPDTLVGLCTERSAAMIVAMVGIIKAGGAYVPLDPAYPAERLEAMADDARLGVIITQHSLQGVVPVRSGCTCVRIDADWADIMASSDAPVCEPVTASDLAYVIYTSGSTGKPKGAAIPHRGVVRLVRDTNYLNIEPGDRIAQASSSSFDAATFEIWGALLNGASVIGISKETALSAETFASELERGRVTTLFVTTALFNVLSQKPPAAFKRLRHLLFGGEAVDPTAVRRLLREAPPQRLLHVYGPTETTTYASWYLVSTVAEDATTIPIGRGIAQTQLYVLDARLQPVGAGMSGELYVGGDGGARGYLNRPDTTAERFVPDPFSARPGARMYRTGDLVRWTTDGQIVFIGRLDGQVKIRGFRMELGEIEAALTAHPAVRQAVVAPFGTGADKRVGAWVVLQVPATPEIADQLRDHARRRLPDYMVPAAFTWMDAIPLNANGKVDKERLPQPTTDRQITLAYVAPRGAIEESIVAIWQELLGIERVGVRDNLFDLGAHSLLIVQAHARIVADLGVSIPIVSLFEFPTIEALAGRIVALRSEDPAAVTTPPRPSSGPTGEGSALAVIAMAGRFPGAADVETFWANLRNGVEGVRRLSDDELRQGGVDELLLNDPNYVPARGVLDGSELFDAAFFGYTPRDAELMDPQHRLFLECASEALERAGYNPDIYPGRIGVYAGASANSYLLNVAAHPDAIASAGGLQTLIGSGSDFLPTRVSYKLNLRGPSVNVQTACSTSLVAVHQACQSLRNGECDVALAGGVSVGAPVTRGYLYAPGGIGAPDGHCRAFDAQARGTVPGHGVGIVVLKRLAEAVRDGDTIHAVIRGTAVNNDGAAKVGFTAPSVEGQAEVIAAAHVDARVRAADISYVEAHGTGTTLGDPIEIAALTRVFGESRGAKTCAIGSVKTNIGHLDGAAGVANLIKVVLAVSHGELPPSLHFTEPNPELHLERTPFEINTRLRAWPASARRLAGVSSFGIGGTNAHVIVEEPPAAAVSDAGRPWQLVPLSAKTPAALDALAQRLAGYFGGDGATFADAAYTLQVGRRSHAHRRFAVARTAADAQRALDGAGGPAVVGSTVEPRDRTTVFMFSGQGSQYHGMASGLYDADPNFRADFDRCAELFEPLLQCDLRQVLFADEAEEATKRLTQTRLTQPALFTIEYSLARFWMRCGVKPAAMIGHSIGEYVAACLAGVFSLEDAVIIVSARARVMQEQPPGAMLAVMVSECDIATRLPAGVTVAAINSPSLTVLAGPSDAIAAMEARLAADGMTARRVDTSHAFHSAMMQPAADALAREIRKLTLRPPAIPFVSNVTGTWITPEEATSADYWARHLRAPVKFADGIQTLAADTGRVFIEVGPGRALAGVTREMVSADVPVLTSTRHQRSSDDDYAVMLDALGRAWLAGIPVDWSGLHSGTRRRRVPLPTYPFDRRRYWIDRHQPAMPAAPERRGVDDWLFVPGWTEAASAAPVDAADRFKKWLVFVDDDGLGDRVVTRLIAQGHDVVSVSAATRFARVAPSAFTIDPSRAQDYADLIRELDGSGRRPDAVAHFWGVAADGPTGAAASARCIDRGFYSLVWLEQALADADANTEQRIGVVTTHARAVTPSDVVVPAKATVNGPLLVVPAERSSVTTCAIDLTLAEWLSASDSRVDALIRDLAAAPEPIVAYRETRRLVPQLAPSPLPAVPRSAHPAATPRLRPRGVYLVTGGFGGIGSSIARELAARYQARLILIGRGGVPERAAWANYLASHRADDRIAQSIEFIRELELAGAEVLAVSASVTDGAALRGAVQRAIERWGAIHGVIHSAGVAGGGIVQLKTREAATAVLAPKIDGTEALADVLEGCALDFFAFCSSLTALIGGAGQVDYCAANAYLDAFAHEYTRRTGRFSVAINWDTWRDVGMAVDTVVPQSLLERRATALARGMSPAEGVDVFLRIVAYASSTQVAVSTTGLARADHANLETAPASLASYARPEGREYVPPADDVERVIAEVWQEMIGVDRVSRTDDFFSLGGHSLLATRVIAHVKQRCGVDVSLRTFLEHPTLSGLAERVGELQWAAGSRSAVVGVADREEIEI